MNCSIEKPASMKFKRLTQEELDELKHEFIQFLASNSITADDWEDIKQNKPEKAEDLIAIFSDIVYQKSLEKIEYLEFVEKAEIKTFYFGDQEAEMVGLKVEGQDVDLTDQQTVQQLANEGSKDASTSVELFRGNKEYSQEREEEIFHLMEAGAQPSDGTKFQALKQVYNRN